MAKVVSVPQVRQDREYAYVRLNGRKIQLGKWGTPEAEKAYRRIVQTWASNPTADYERRQEKTTYGKINNLIHGIISGVRMGHAIQTYLRQSENPAFLPTHLNKWSRNGKKTRRASANHIRSQPVSSQRNRFFPNMIQRPVINRDVNHSWKKNGVKNHSKIA